MYKNIMVDIETLDTKSSASIISIGAVVFDIKTGKSSSSFYKEVDIQSCLDLGLTVSGDTISWLLKQQVTLLQDNPSSIKEVLEEFAKFCSKDYYIWANSPRFDLSILQNVYNKLGIDVPWDFRKERCVRTLTSFNPSIKDAVRNEGKELGFIPHNALDDCLIQIEYCSKLWNYIKNYPPVTF